jgi:hypothetical protein
MYYTSELCRVRGTVFGEAVSGFGGLDQAWMPMGMSYFQGIVYRCLHSYWFYWANRYADGSFDYGIAFRGPGDWNLCFYVDNGKTYVSTENESKRTWAAEGYPSQVDFKTPTHQFRFTCNSRTTPMPEFHVQWTTGHVINLAKKEKPIEGTCTVEYRVREQCDD